MIDESSNGSGRGRHFTHFALVCFADGDARVYGYYPDREEIYDLPKQFKLNADREEHRLTYIEYGTDKQLLITKARMARTPYWSERQYDIVDMLRQ